MERGETKTVDTLIGVDNSTLIGRLTMRLEIWIDGKLDTVIEDWYSRIACEDDVFEKFEDEIEHMEVGDEIDVGDGWKV